MRLLKSQESTMVEGRDGVLEAIDTLWTGKLGQRIGLSESGGWTASISVAYQHDIQRPTRLSNPHTYTDLPSDHPLLTTPASVAVFSPEETSVGLRHEAISIGYGFDGSEQPPPMEISHSVIEKMLFHIL